MNAITVTGINEAVAKLEALDKKIATSYGKKSVRAGAKVVLKVARADAPFRTGTTRAALRIKAERSPTGTIAVSVALGKKKYAGKAYYGSFIIHGWHPGKRVSKSRKLFRTLTGKPADTRGFVAPNNFIDRAFQSAGDVAAETMGETLVQLVNSEASS